VTRLWKTCGSIADQLCTDCRRTIFFDEGSNKIAESPDRGAASFRASLAPPQPVTRILSRVEHAATPQTSVTPVVFNETIHGRAYVIEVHAVGRDRWRACLKRRGATTALMPFYGTTPDDAARQLAVWLTKANRGAIPA
jgi:hypothetical protein